ncbi:MAG: rl13 [Parachlamydiales bacterium]|nr:rl13 [Parachlamydiales bacterium]
MMVVRFSFGMLMNHSQNTVLVTNQQALDARKWFLFDASNKTLGRFAAEVAKVLMGKHRPDYTPNIDTGDGVVIINADQIKVTGMKHARKIYRSYTGFMGGLREVPYETMLARKPTYVLEHAILGMMPKSRLGRQQLKKLRIYAGAQHEVEAQKPIPVNG